MVPDGLMDETHSGDAIVFGFLGIEGGELSLPTTAIYVVEKAT